MREQRGQEDAVHRENRKDEKAEMREQRGQEYAVNRENREDERAEGMRGQRGAKGRSKQREQKG